MKLGISLTYSEFFSYIKGLKTLFGYAAGDKRKQYICRQTNGQNDQLFGQKCRVGSIQTQAEEGQRVSQRFEYGNNSE